MTSTSHHVDTVYNTINRNQFSSVDVVANLSGLNYRDVQVAVDRLVAAKKIYISVGGSPRRYSVVPVPTSHAETFALTHAQSAHNIPVVDGILVR